MDDELETGQQQLTTEGQEQTQETDDAGTDADFDAGFAGTPTETPEKPKASTEETAQAQDATTAETTAQPAATPTGTPPAEQKYVQITEAEFNLLKVLPQRLDQAFGKIGGVERIMQTLQTQQSRQPSGQPLKLSEADFAELKEEFPDLAELQMKGLQRVLERVNIPGSDPQAIERVVNERTAAVRAELVDSRLDEIVDGNWRQEVKTQKFKDWISSQPQDVQALGESESLRDAATLMRKFKVFRDAPPPAPAQETKPATPNVKSRAIAAAVPPKGNQAVSRQPTAEDDFEAGFKSG